MNESEPTAAAGAAGAVDAHPQPKHHKLGELASTAICGNDITSSCLYVSALAIAYGGRWAPICLLGVAVVLYFFRSIYAEVVGALPLNGGAYNALLNTTSKGQASIAACLTILSYMATAVISANEAMHYAHNLWHGLDIWWATVGLLALFMVLSIIGITESAVVAIGIFLTHLATLTLLLLMGGLWLFENGLETLFTNLADPTIPPPKEALDSLAAAGQSLDQADSTSPGIWMALFFGFSSAMLGISGFESSSNFVEEQKPGVFPKTLRNMWWAVSIFNPLMALLALALIPMLDVSLHQDSLLAHLGGVASGDWLKTLISIDAVLVLSGAVLTSFVGVNGLIHRMTLDRCLPQLLLKTNRRGTTHRIIIAFFLLSVSVHYLTGGDIKAMAGVYTIAFLSVMVLFGLGNILLKVRRNRLPRPTRAPWGFVVLAILAVMIGLVGNVTMNPDYFRVFLTYFIPTMLVIGIMLGRIAILKGTLFIARDLLRLTGPSKPKDGATSRIDAPPESLAFRIRDRIEDINAQQIVFFTRGDNVSNLNQAILYVLKNEHTNRMKVVTVVDSLENVPERLERDLQFLDEVYPEIDIEYVPWVGDFGPELIEELSKKWNVPVNLMFIGSPTARFDYGLDQLGGVRLII